MSVVESNDMYDFFVMTVNICTMVIKWCSVLCVCVCVCVCVYIYIYIYIYIPPTAHVFAIFMHKMLNTLSFCV